MNQFKGNIAKISVEDQISVVDVQCDTLMFKAVLLDTPETLPHLVQGADVTVLFKETEVIISTDLDPPISLRNRVKGPIKNVIAGDLLCELEIQNPAGNVRSVITKNAVEQLDLVPGKEVLAMIKTNEIMLEF